MSLIPSTVPGERARFLTPADSADATALLLGAAPAQVAVTYLRQAAAKREQAATGGRSAEELALLASAATLLEVRAKAAAARAAAIDREAREQLARVRAEQVTYLQESHARTQRLDGNARELLLLQTDRLVASGDVWEAAAIRAAVREARYRRERRY